MSAWIQHVKAYQNAHGCSYKDALKHASATYQKGSGLAFRAGDQEYHTGSGAFGLTQKDMGVHEGGNLKKTARKQGKRLMGALGDRAVMQLMGMGAIGDSLKRAAADNSIRLMDSGTNRATSEMEGGNLLKATKAQLIKIITVLGTKGAEKLSGMGAIGDSLKRAAADNSIRLMDSGTNRATSEMEGSSVNRLNKANRWQSFVDATIRDTIDTGGKAARVYYDSTNPMSQMGFGLKRHKRYSGRALMAAGY